MAAATSTATPPPPITRIRNTWGRIATGQVFDYFPSTGTTMSASEITADASRYDMVWASFDPAPWRSSNPQALVGRYYIPEEDNSLISGHTLSWWQANHPDWMLYACDSSGNPTNDLAYVPGVGFPDVVLDIHNPAVVDYQLKTSLLPYVVAHNYNAVSIDEVLFRNVLVGGNPKFGQTIKSGEYGCGIYQNGTFVKRYTGPTDPAWTGDMLNWVKTLRSIVKSDTAFSSYKIAVVVNHPIGSTSDPNELALIQNIDAILDESGFSDYGNYQLATASHVFLTTYNYMRWVQAHAVAIQIIDKFATEQTVTPDQLEYSIGTYLMGAGKGADLFVVGKNGAGYGYGAEQWHPEYATALGSECADMYGGASYDANNPQIYYRRYVRGLVVLNSGSLPRTSETATLPNHPYKDIEGRPVTNPLTVASNDAWVMTTTQDGCI